MPNDFDRECSDVKSGGVEGILGLDQIDWGGEAGKFYECWKINPCCGSPDPKQMLCCFVCWFCCHWCSMSKLYATSVGQDCALVPHCLMVCFLPCITAILVRNNLRRRAGVRGNCVGDLVCVWCCGCCSQCQECRSVATSGWNMMEPSLTMPEIVAPDIIFLN